MIPLVITAFLIWQQYLSTLVRLRTLLNTPDVDSLHISARLSVPTGLREFQTALSRLPGIVPRLIRQVLGRMQQNMEFREAFQQCRHAETARFSYSFYILGALVMAAPLLGLLGTVLGMIDTFTAVAERSHDTASMVSAGISKALITTQIGLVAALPGTFGLAHVHRLYQRLKNVIDQCESHLALVFEHPPR